MIFERTPLCSLYTPYSIYFRMALGFGRLEELLSEAPAAALLAKVYLSEAAQANYYVRVGLNYGPFVGPIIIRHLVFRRPKKRTIVLMTTHVGVGLDYCSQNEGRGKFMKGPVL